MRRFAFLGLGVFVVAALWIAASAQTKLGTIHGSVKDPAGAVLAGAEVKLTQGNTTVSTVLTDASGEFTFPNLPPASYDVSVSLSGFQRGVMTVTVGAGTTEEVIFPMVIGSVQNTILLNQPTAERSESDRLMPRVTESVASVTGAIAGVAGRRVVAPAPFGIMPAPSARPFNTESYDKIDDNAWTFVTQRPLSTFSADVDTASYANIRRFLNQGQLPPKDAVRVEELINYFTYDYPQPTGAAPFSITTSMAACPWDTTHRLALVGLQGRKIDRTGIPPRNLVFLIDVSGSMDSPEKLPLVKSSLTMLARNLTSKDRIAIVVYAGAAGLVLPSTDGNDTGMILEAIGRLEAGGSTNGAEGLTLAYQAAQAHFIKGGVNRVVLATDGDFNVGVTNEGDLVRLIEEKRAAGVTLSVLGFGMGNLKDSTMEKLADRGNGNYAYIDSASEAQKVLVQEAGGTLVTIAKDVKLQVEFNPRVVSAYRLIGYENRVLQDQEFNDDKKDAGDMGAGHSVTALYEIVPFGGKVDLPGVDPLTYQQAPALSESSRRDETMNVKIRYKEPDGETSSLLSATVSTAMSESANLGFAAAVAEFGMVLRDSEFKGHATFEDAVKLAERYKGSDPFGHRAELLRLMRIAESLRPVPHATE